MRIDHQLSTSPNYFPNWTINFLFIGSFNPSDGDRVLYYYGRRKNQFWKLISTIFNEDFNTEAANFFELLKKHKIGCVDLIHSIESSNKIKGYADSSIINRKVLRYYNTEKISSIIKANPEIKIYSTWGTGSKFSEWRSEVEKIQNLCELQKLVSPSLAARVQKGTNKFQYMLEDWTAKIDYRKS